MLLVPVGEESLYIGDGDRLVKIDAVAFLLARMLANPSADRRERIIGDRRFVGLFEVARSGECDISAGIAVDRAGIVARSCAQTGHGKLVRHRLRILLKDRLPVAQQLVVFVLDGNRAFLSAGSASGAFFKVDKIRLKGQFGTEITRLARQLRQFGVGDYLDIAVRPSRNKPR